MQGHLYVENKEAPKLRYQSRFFVLFPFCGLRWFPEEPEDLSESSLLTSGEDGGWIFGGNIRISSVVMEEVEKVYGEVFPFSLFVMSSEEKETIQVRLATDDEDIRAVWTDEIKKAIYIQNYVHSCIQCDAIPSKSIFCAALAGNDVVHLENIQMSVPTLGSLIMVCKFNYNMGTNLKAVHLENVSLADNSCALLSSLFSFTPLLESLSLANNYLSDDGFNVLSPCLKNCIHLNLIDFSSNFLTDVGIHELSKVFRYMKKLHHLDFSRNRLGKKSAKDLALHLTGYDDSRLTYLNVSYNSMGNSIAELVALLMMVENSTIINVDVSFCHISSSGFKELCFAIPKCKTLQILNLSGNFADDSTLGHLMETISAHQRKFGVAAARAGDVRGESILRREALYHASSQLEIQLGGLLLTDAKSPKCLSFSTVRSVISHVTEVSSTGQAHIRKRMDVLFSEQLCKEHTALSQQKRHIDLKKAKVNVIVCIRAQLMPYMENISDLIEAFAFALKCHPGQFVVLSATEVDDCDSTFIIFTIVEASRELQKSHVERIIKKRCLDNECNGTAKSSLMSKGGIWLLPSAEKIAIVLQKLSHISSPLLRNIGIRTVYIQRRDKFTSKPIGSGYQCHIVGGGSGGQGIADSCIPPLFPHADALEEMRMPASDPYLDAKPSSLDFDSIEVKNNSSGPTRRLSLEMMNQPGFFFQEDEDDEKDEMDLSELDDEDENENARTLLYTAPDDNVDSVSTVLLDDSKFSSLINRLKLDYEINTEAGEFWSAVFNDPEDAHCGAVIDAGLKTAYNADGIFHNVGKRQHITTAMFERDNEKLTIAVNVLKNENCQSAQTIELAERLQKEITMLRHDSENLDALAQGPEDINIVEEFLINCGRIGYTGPEILVAVELREYLVQWAMELDETFESSQLQDLKQRALVTNLMISRNFEELESKLLLLRHTLEENLYNEANTLLDNAKVVRSNLSRAMTGNDRVLLENILAEAAYYNIYDDFVAEAIEYVNSMTSDISVIFADLVNALQDGSKEDLNAIFCVMDDIGWNSSIVDREVILKMFDGRNQLIEETNAMNELYRISNVIQQNNSSSSVDNEDKPLVKTLEIMSCIRTIKNLGLAQLQEAKQHIIVLENQVKKAAKLASQEDEILQLIDSKDYDKLGDMLSGVGSGTLVMSAPTEDDMIEWMQILELVCRLGSPQQLLDNTEAQNDKLSCVSKSGVLEKAARGKEKIHRNWRQRFFVLDGLTISYFTKEGGERKGCVRVGGGKIRRLEPSEEQSSGKSFCFELREGRDLSAIDPDLIKEGHRLICEVETEKLNEKLVKAIAETSGDLCSSILKEADVKGYSLDFELVGQAKTILLRLQQIEVKKELRTVCKFIPRGQIQEVVKKSATFRLDQELWMCKLARVLTERAEAELAILRSRGWLKMQDDNAFKRSLTSVQRFDLKRLGGREKKLLAAVLLQNAGSNMEKTVVRDGAMPVDAVDIVSQTLDGVMQYFVETEPMQLARLVLESTKQDTSGSKSAILSTKGKSTRNVGLQKASSVFIMPDNSVSSFLRNKTDFTLDKYSALRTNSQPAGFLSRKSTAGGMSSRKSHIGRKSAIPSQNIATESSESVTFTADALMHPLLRINKSLEKEALELFKALQVVMNDRSLQSCVSSRSALFVGLNSASDTNFSTLASRIVEAGIASPLLRDELYVQLCKQLTSNPSIKSEIVAWTLLCAYLHCFPPSMEFLPYLKHFLLQASFASTSSTGTGGGGTSTAATATAPKRGTIKARFTMAARLSLLNPSSSSASSAQEDLNTVSNEEDKKYLKSLVTYANRVLHWTEEEMALGTKGFKSEISMVDEHLMIEMMKRTQLNLKICVMTGSVYDVSFRFGELTNVFSILVYLFDQIVGESYANVDAMKMMPNKNISTSSDSDHDSSNKAGAANRGPKARISVLERSSSTFFGDRSTAYGFKHPDIISKCFRGFCFYNDTDGLGNLDAKSLPVQPAHSSSIAWNHDMIWDTLQNFSNSSRLLYLRRKFLLVSEILIDSQLDLFGDEVSHSDSIGLKKLWVKWLCDPIPDLPVDYMRVDLLFSEESRYVNSQLYGISDDGCAYLLAIQLLLTWNIEEEKMAIGKNVTDLKWGSGHAYVMRNIDTSVRPSVLSTRPWEETAAQERRETRRNSDDRPKSTSSTAFNRLSVLRKGRLSAVEEDDDESEEVSSVDVDNENSFAENLIHWYGQAIDINALEDTDIESLKAKLIFLGISDDNITLDLIESVAYFMSQFQALAMQLDLSTQNQRYRYMMKTAYLNYVMSWSLAGGSFAMTSCDITGNFAKTLLCVSGNGFFLLTVDDWSLIFHSPLYDIESYNVSSAHNETNSSSEDKLLTIIINDLTIKIISTSIDDIKNLLDGLCLEMLSKGVYRHGLEGGFDILENDNTFVSSTDPVAVFSRFQSLFSFLPAPPTPLPLSKSKQFVEPPKSRRTILAEARAEEERIELEQARLAAQAAADRNQAHIEKGRQALTTMMEDDDDEDDEDDDAKKKTGRVKKQRRRISLLGKGRQHVNPLQMRMQMVENAVCGVSSRPAIVPNVVVPPIPERRTGMRTDSMLESGLDLSEKPPLISAKNSLDVTVPFNEKLVMEPLLLPREAMALKKVKFPLVSNWENKSVDLYSSFCCEWMMNASDYNENDEYFDNDSWSGVHSETKSEDGVDEAKVDEGVDKSSLSSVKLDHNTIHKSEVSELKNHDENDTVVGNHNLKPNKSPKDTPMHENTTVIDHDIKSNEYLKNAQVDNSALGDNHDLESKQSVKYSAQLDEDASFYSHDLDSKQTLKETHVDEDASFYSHELGSKKSLQDTQLDEDASFYSHDLESKQSLQDTQLDEDASFYSHDFESKLPLKNTQLDEDASFYSQDLKPMHDVVEDESFYSNEIEHMSPVKESGNEDDDGSFYSHDL